MRTVFVRRLLIAVIAALGFVGSANVNNDVAAMIKSDPHTCFDHTNECPSDRNGDHIWAGY